MIALHIDAWRMAFLLRDPQTMHGGCFHTFVILPFPELSGAAVGSTHTKTVLKSTETSFTMSSTSLSSSYLRSLESFSRDEEDRFQSDNIVTNNQEVIGFFSSLYNSTDFSDGEEKDDSIVNNDNALAYIVVGVLLVISVLGLVVFTLNRRRQQLRQVQAQTTTDTLQEHQEDVETKVVSPTLEENIEEGNGTALATIVSSDIDI